MKMKSCFDFQSVISYYLGGRAPSSGFSDWPVPQKTTKKNMLPLQFGFNRSKVQAGDSGENRYMDSCTFPRLFLIGPSFRGAAS
jgi:hypothetical protein